MDYEKVAQKNDVNAQSVLFNRKELMLKLTKYSTRYQSLSYDDEIFCCQNVEVNLLSISSIPSAGEKIPGDVIDVKFIIIKYLLGKENYSSAIQKAVDQQYKFLHVSDKSQQNLSSGISIPTADENYLVVKDTILDEKANAVERTKDDGVKRRKAFDSTVCSRGMCFKSLPGLVGLNTSKRMDYVKEVKEIKSTLEAEAVGVYDDEGAVAQVDCLINCENGEDLPVGWNVSLQFGGDALRPHASGWLDNPLVWSEHKRSKIMVEMEMISSIQNNPSTVDAVALGIIFYYPGKCFSGDFVSYRYYPINLSCLGLVLQMMTCVLQALDATEIFPRK